MSREQVGVRDSYYHSFQGFDKTSGAGFFSRQSMHLCSWGVHVPPELVVSCEFAVAEPRKKS